MQSLEGNGKFAFLTTDKHGAATISNAWFKIILIPHDHGTAAVSSTKYEIMLIKDKYSQIQGTQYMKQKAARTMTLKCDR